MINVLNILFVVIATGLILCFFRKKDETRDYKYYSVSVLILSCALVFLLTYGLGSIPNGLHVDEAGMAYDALNLSRYGVDRFLYPNPVYFINFGGGQNALYTYLASFVIRVLGFSVTTLRLSAVFLSFLAAFCFVLMTKKAHGKYFSVIVLFLLCVLPFSIMHSRWSLESYLLFPMSIISCFCLFWAFLKHKKRWFILAGISFGLTLYTYAVSYLILPIFLAIVFLYSLINKKVTWSECFCFAIPLGILALPLILMLLVNNGIIPEITTPFLSVPEMFFYRGSEFSLSNIFNNWDLFGILFGTDGLIYNSFGEFGTMYYFSIPFCIYGFVFTIKTAIQSVKKKSMSLDFMILTFFVSVFLVTMLLDGPNINRANAIYFPLFYFVAVGIYHLVCKRLWTGVVILVMYLIFFGAFLYSYFVEYPREVHDTYFFVSQDDFENALSFANQLDSDEIYVIDEGYHQPYIYTVLALEMDPYTFNEELIMDNNDIVQIGKYSFQLDEIKEDDVYIFLKEHMVPEEIKNADFDCMKFGSITVYY